MKSGLNHWANAMLPPAIVFSFVVVGLGKPSLTGDFDGRNLLLLQLNPNLHHLRGLYRKLGYSGGIVQEANPRKPARTGVAGGRKKARNGFGLLGMVVESGTQAKANS